MYLSLSLPLSLSLSLSPYTVGDPEMSCQTLSLPLSLRTVAGAKETSNASTDEMSPKETGAQRVHSVPGAQPCITTIIMN